MKYVTCMGALWKHTDTAWIRYVRDSRRYKQGAQDTPDLDDYGNFLQARTIDVTDFNPDTILQDLRNYA